MKKLSICITRYKEDWQICKPMFDSIALQRGINFGDLEVIVVNDGRDKLLTGREFLGYPFRTAYIPMDTHMGVSVARNYALDRAFGEYVMFCDIDDMFLNNCGLHLLFCAMNEQPDFVCSSFVEEVVGKNGAYKIVRHDKDITFIHGKMYRREYLNENHIRFDETLTIHEDGYFNVIASICTENKKDTTTPFYLWKWNPDSVVRRDPKAFVLRTYDHLMRSRAAICRELEKRGYIDEYFNSVVKTVIDSYYDFQNPEYLSASNAESVAKAEKAFKTFYDEFGKDYKEANISRIAEMMFICRQNAYVKGMRVEQQTITEFLNHITRDVK